MMTLKEKIYHHYLQAATEKLHRLQQLLADLRESGANETKRTAGDKHETALAMLQAEQARAQAQLQEAQAQKAALQKINPALQTGTIVTGSLVHTNRGTLFVSLALGKAVIDGEAVTALSPQSPLGRQLMGLAAGNSATINNTQYIIESIL